MVDKGKKSLFAAIVLGLSILICQVNNAFSEIMQQVDSGPVQGDQINKLTEKVDKLEQLVMDQAALIQRQSQLLSKVIDAVPQAKSAVAPP